jgi:urease subunit beta
MVHLSPDGPGAMRILEGRLELNADRGDERVEIVFVNTGDRPIQIGSHIHLPDVNSALDFDRSITFGCRLDIPSGTSQRFEPGAGRSVAVIPLAGARVVAGLQIRTVAPDREGDAEVDAEGVTHG